MFERFTDDACRVMAFANQQARSSNHSFIGTPDVLLGIIKEGSGFATQVLKSRNVGLDKVRSQIQTGSDMTLQAKLPSTPRVQKVIKYAVEESCRLNHNHVSTDHILLGLLRDPECEAVQILLRLHVKPEELQKDILMLLGASE